MNKSQIKAVYISRVSHEMTDFKIDRKQREKLVKNVRNVGGVASIFNLSHWNDNPAVKFRKH